MTTSAELGTVIVTGGASGLGAAVAAAVREAGGTPVVLDLKPPDTDHAYVEMDLADTRATEAAVAQVASTYGDLRAVVTCAGTDACGALDQVSGEAWDRVLAVNLLGTAAVVRAAVGPLRATHGRIVTIGSTLGLRPAGDATAYCASKHGIVGFSRALAMELAGQVGVTMVVPGGMQTHFFDGRPEQYRPGPDADLMDPAHVATAVVGALRQPAGVELREVIVTASTEPSWP
ncbi:SDR family oxidoreductase [Flexivirga sp. ID2601S]|uniref:SDR family oxidoreductase n=1 Tax=Flexivirga aerilata TaxID=1656889 RepID=A0A849AKV8_9MICO|nr:SDR family oxidoreductase [Flexivirga aerilata]NNG41045.1 SDR family oxidoreductase [Flexivirga aerilata]